MRELIERQAAIDAIHCNIVVTGRENAELVAKTIGEFADRIKALPTIQPEKAQLSQEGTTSDAISRTETVEHFNRLLGATVPVSDYDEGFIDGVQFAISTVSTMPTIQPEMRSKNERSKVNE